MAAFDRDSALERQQIHEISINVARRLLRVLERSRTAPPHIAADIGSGARAISEIQREIEQLMASLPAHGALDIAVFTHVLGSHRRALDMLEVLEGRLAQAGMDEQRSDAVRAHAALIATSREIERTARQAQPQFQSVPPPAAGRAPLALAGPGGAAQPYPGAPQRQLSAQQAAQHPRQLPSSSDFGRRPQPPLKRKRPSTGLSLPSLATIRAALTDRKASAAFAIMTVIAGLVVSVVSLIGGSNSDATHQAALTAGQKLDGRLGAAEHETAGEEASPSPGGMSAEAAPIGLSETGVSAITDPLMEQPYLVVLATRQTTEELHQDFRSLKGTYPEILGAAKARVDRVQGQDRQNWYRLSLIPPQSRADAKALCGSLKAAGMIGCWIKPLPLGRPAQ